MPCDDWLHCHCYNVERSSGWRLCRCWPVPRARPRRARLPSRRRRTIALKLVNQWASDHCHTLAGGTPILALDMYEHSYHIDYGTKTADYVGVFMSAINWPAVERFYEGLRK
jgi:superoxide dismutase